VATPPDTSNVGYGDMDPADWAMTATCEEGGNNSPEFGYYGILPTTWRAEGGLVYSEEAGGASQYDQLVIESHFQHYPPDVGHCNGDY
jgi:hypothetical protein